VHSVVHHGWRTDFLERSAKKMRFPSRGAERHPGKRAGKEGGRVDRAAARVLDGAERSDDGLRRPYRAWMFFRGTFPGRCPGLELRRAVGAAELSELRERLVAGDSRCTRAGGACPRLASESPGGPSRGLRSTRQGRPASGSCPTRPGGQACSAGSPGACGAGGVLRRLLFVPPQSAENRRRNA
jgi:hypothetical protein